MSYFYAGSIQLTEMMIRESKKKRKERGEKSSPVTQIWCVCVCTRRCQNGVIVSRKAVALTSDTKIPP